MCVFVQPLEARVAVFTEQLLTMPRPSDKVAVLGHDAFFKAMLGIDMTACQLYFRDEQSIMTIRRSGPKSVNS